jgi:hypothetical protein
MSPIGRKDNSNNNNNTYLENIEKEQRRRVEGSSSQPTILYSKWSGRKKTMILNVMVYPA